MKIILASASPRRKQLLKQLGLEFAISPSKIEEKLNPRLKPRTQAEVLSLQKAEEVHSKNPDSLIISADTIVVLNEEILGKPKDEKDAKRMLKRLSGKTHRVVTGFTILGHKKKVVRSVETKVTFKKLNDKEVAKYILNEKPFDNAGSYRIQDLGAIFVEKIEGDYFNIVGLPLSTLARELKRFGVKIL